MRKFFYGFVFFVCLLFFTPSVSAATKYWIGTAGGNFTTDANWTTTASSACSTNPNTTAPGSADVAQFVSACTNSATIDATINVQGLELNTGYTGTVTQSAAITIGSSGYYQNAGTFSGGSAAIDVNNTIAAFRIDSGTFTNTSGGMTITNNFTINGGTFTNTGKTVTFDGTADSTVSCSSTLGGTFVITKTVANTDVTLGAGCTISLGASPTSTIGPGSGAVDAGIHVSGTLIIDSGTWTINAGGSADSSNYFIRTLSGGTITHNGSGWDINDGYLSVASGSTVTYAGTTMSIERGFTQSGSFDLTGVTITFDGANDADDSYVEGTFTVSGMTINKSGATANTTPDGAITVSGSFTRTDGPLVNPPSARTLTVQGSFSMSTTDTFGGANLTTVMGGGNNQTITQNAGTISGPFNVNKTGGAASIASGLNLTTGSTCNIVEGTFSINGRTFTCGSTFTVEDGGLLQRFGTSGESLTTPTLNSGSTVTYTGDGDSAADTVTVTTMIGTYHHLTINSTDGTTDTFQLGAALTTNGALTVTAGTLSINGQTLSSTGAFTIQTGAVLQRFGTSGETTTTPTLDSGSTVIYTGDGDSAADTVTVTTMIGTYHHLTINSTDGATDTFQLGAALDVNGLFTLTAGTFSVSGTNYGINVGGGWTDTGAGTFTEGTGTVTFDGTGTINSNETFNNVAVSAGTLTVSTNSLQAAGTLTVSGGTLTMNGVAGTITGLATVSGGALQASTATQTYNAGLTVSSGTFTGSSGTVDVNGTLTISGGTFTAPSSSGSLTISGDFTHTAGGTFTHNSGTTTFDGATQATVNVATSEDFYSLTVNKTASNPDLTITTGDTLTVNGTFTWTDGDIDSSTTPVGVIDAKGDVSIAAGADDYTTTASAITLTGTGTQTCTLTGGGKVGNFTINNASATCSTSGSGQFDLSGAFTLSNGTFSGGSIDLDTNSALTISGGTFTSTSGNFNVGSSWTHTAGTFNNNSGTITFDANNTATIDVATSETFNTVIVNKGTDSTTITITSGDTIITTGTLTLTNGVVNTGTIQAQGSVTVASTFDGGSAALTFAGTANQNYTDNGGTPLTGTVTVDKSSGTLTLATNGTFNASGQDFTISAGTLDLAGYNLTVNDAFSLNGTSTLKVQGGETISGIDTVSSSSTVQYTGTSTYTGLAAGNTYGNLTINGTGGTWNVGSTVTVNAALTVTAGTLNMNGQAGTMTDLVTINGGTLQASTATQTYNAGLTVSSGTFTGSSGTVDVNGTLTISGGTFTAPSGTVTISSNFTHSGGTFTHNSGTVTLDGGNQTISGTSTFNNLKKTVTSASTLTFPASATQTIVGTMTLQGASGALLSLRSSTSGTQWRIDPQGTRTIEYLDVKDSYNINATAITASGFNITDSGNNDGWSFNASPDAPSSLGSSAFVSGGWTTDTTPTLTFTLSDTDTSNTVLFRLQIDNDSDFSSSLVDYTAALAAQGSRSFTVGQAVGSGTYTTGNDGQTLSDGTGGYYWRVRAEDSAGSTSSYATANSGSVAFKVDATAPTAVTLDSPADKSYTRFTRPTFKFKLASTPDATSGMDKYTVTIDNGEQGDFTINDIPASRTSTYALSRYTVSYENFGDGDSSNNYISVYTKHSSDWNSGENDGVLKEGKRTWTVTAYDNAGNTSASSWVLYVDYTSPTLSGVTLSSSLGVHEDFHMVTDTTPTFEGTITDTVSLDAVELSFSKERTFLGISGGYSLERIDTIRLNTSALSYAFSISPSSLTYGTYTVTITGIDKAENRSSSTTFSFKLLSEEAAKKLLTIEGEKDIVKKIIEESEISLPALEKQAKIRREREAQELEKTVAQLVDWKDRLIKFLQKPIVPFQAFLGALIGVQKGRGAETVTQPARNLEEKGEILTAQYLLKNEKSLTNISNATEAFIDDARVALFESIPAAVQPLMTQTGQVVSIPVIIAGSLVSKTTSTLLDTGETVITQTILGGQKLLTTMDNNINDVNYRTRQATKYTFHSLQKPIDASADFFSRLHVAADTFYALLIDPTPTVISDVTIEKQGTDYAVISWKTNHVAWGKINYGETLSYGQEVILYKREKYHLARLTNLKPNTHYYFEVMSQNKNYVYDAYYGFTTKK